MMFKTTSSKHAPWHVVHSDDKKRARLNCISHLLSLIPYKKIKHKKVKLPKRSNKEKYDDRASLKGINLVTENTELEQITGTIRVRANVEEAPPPQPVNPGYVWICQSRSTLSPSSTGHYRS
jgi:hypothetical protein